MRCKSNAAQPRWLWVMATIPELPGGTAGVTASHPAFAAAIARHGQLIFVHTKNNSALSHRLELRLTASFAAAGLDFASHAKFIPLQNMEAFDGLLVRADLCLDTISFSGFNTAMQALGQGAPLVAYEGALMRGCLASGTLRQMGLHELVATNDAEFVAIATTLARDVAYRATIRARIMAETPKLYDDRDAVEAFQEEIRSLRK
jgi:protein O-GlcNAc transferase